VTTVNLRILCTEMVWPIVILSSVVTVGFSELLLADSEADSCGGGVLIYQITFLQQNTTSSLLKLF